MCALKINGVGKIIKKRKLDLMARLLNNELTCYLVEYRLARMSETTNEFYAHTNNIIKECYDWVEESLDEKYDISIFKKNWKKKLIIYLLILMIL